MVSANNTSRAAINEQVNLEPDYSASAHENVAEESVVQHIL